MTLSLSASEFNSQKTSITNGVAAALNVDPSAVQLTLVTRRSRRILQSGVSVEATVTTDSSDATSVTSLVQDASFSSSLQTAIQNEGVTVTVSDVSEPTVTNLGAANESTSDDSGSDVSLYLIIAGCVVVVLGLVAVLSHSCCGSKKGEAEGEVGGTPFDGIGNTVL